MFTGTPGGRAWTARSKSFRRSLPEIVRFCGGVRPCVGRPSVRRRMLSGWGRSAAAATNAFSRLVPPWGAVLRSRATAASRDLRSLAPRASVPSVPGERGPAPRCRRRRSGSSIARELGREPVGGPHRAAPLVGAHAVRLGQQAPAHGVDDGVGEHARGGVHEEEDALAPDLEAGQVLAVAVAHEGAHLVARHLAAGRSAGEPLVALLQRAQVGLQLVDVLPLRDRLVARRWPAPPATASPRRSAAWRARGS